MGLSLSVDAFAAAIGKGATGSRPRFRDALRVGAIFGLFEAVTPAIGWAIGLALSAWVAKVDHWVAFFLLVAVGLHMLWQAATVAEDGDSGPDETKKSHGFVHLAATALATSLDAMAVGVSLAALNVNIFVACLMIGGITTVVATIGVLIGKQAGAHLGRYAEILGGVALIAIGSLILSQHLSDAPVLVP